MAAAAATLEIAPYSPVFEEEWDTAYRVPEAEVYGRSLSTIYKLGAFMVGKSQAEIVSSPEADQARVEFYTSVEEGFGTDKELGGGLEVRDFDSRPVIGGKVMAKDLKTAISDMTAAGLACAVETAKKDKRFAPQLTRSEWDHQNALLVDEMAQGKTDYNTRIVISPFPEEAAMESGDEYWRNIGYVPHLKRGFVQLYYASADGLVSGSLSFDGSNKERLREVFGQHGVDIPEDEVTDNWLKYAITADLSEEQAKELALQITDQAADPAITKSTNTVDVTSEYGTFMEAAFNQSYIHICESAYRGSQTQAATELIASLSRNAEHFNQHYKDAIFGMRADMSRFTDDDAAVLHELLVFSTIEMMRSMHLDKARREHGNGDLADSEMSRIAYLQSLGHEAFRDALGKFGSEGARNNRSYSACGLSISLGKELGGIESKEPQKAFGGEDEDCEYISKKCPMCGEKNVKTKSTKTLVEGSCGCKKWK